MRRRQLTRSEQPRASCFPSRLKYADLLRSAASIARLGQTPLNSLERPSMTDASRFIEKNLNLPEGRPSNSRPPLRFSLLGMLVLTTVLAVMCAILFAMPPSVGAIVCIFLQPCLLAACVVGALHSKDDMRAFCIGALVPFLQSILPGGTGMASWGSYLTMMISQRSFSTARRRNSSNDSVFEFLGNIYSMLENIGPTIMLSMFVFCFASLCCGFTGVLVRRWIARRAA